MPKRKFKHGVSAVPGKPGWYDINYQVNGERVTKRIEAESPDEAVQIRLGKKSGLRAKKEGSDNGGESIIELHEALERLIEKVRNEIELGKRCKTSLSEVVPPYQRFFFDYPKYLEKIWSTTADFTPKDFEAYQDYYGIVLKKPMGASTEMRKISNIFSHFYQMGFITSQKLFELRLVKKPNKNIRPFIGNSDEDFIKVLNWVKETRPRLFDFLYFVSATGRRPKEVKAYRREYVLLKEQFILIPKEITKGKEPDSLPFDNDLKKIVLSAYDFSRKLNSEFLFLNEYGRRFSANNPQLIFKQAAKECGIQNWDKWGIYQLKKRFITVCRSRGLTTEAISSVTGHRDLNSVLKHYSFPDKEQAEKAIDVGKLRLN